MQAFNMFYRFPNFAFNISTYLHRYTGSYQFVIFLSYEEQQLISSVGRSSSLASLPLLVLFLSHEPNFIIFHSTDPLLLSGTSFDYSRSTVRSHQNHFDFEHH
ncbi:uncharacterized protein MELLADRAFT_71463 [Melampsora larici-populina 98AG31]|uniref:Uncharacterized protein n=1 Tax=Melampsora larici-populina (strain 98AG31 / pathotype 3-4-7) TaxID=747676 RepID=F4RGW6_MELLP|nr:uncharacterized protein MELLADRAFT_71463 [Melampsora larici-populina 98AG31]EGG08122.1 hypothetical protein MELLADRAFT_71463 [Melampsora larici-populina 98AG31]